MKSAIIATKSKRMIGMMPDEFLISLIANPPDPTGVLLQTLLFF
jgi:hypothetical protein